MNKHILPFIGRRTLRDITPKDAQIILNKLNGLSESSIHVVRLALTRLFDGAKRNQLIVVSPATDLIPPKGTKSHKRSLTRQEVKLFVSNWRKSRAGIWAMIMLFSGLRRGEVSALEWSDVNFENKSISVRRAIQYNERPIKIGPPKSSAGFRNIVKCV